MKRKFLNHLHYFRAIAIMFVVSAHIIPEKSVTAETMPTLFYVVHLLFQNSTVFFTFISGFLFEYLSHSYNYLPYISKKIRYVIVPYLIMASILLAMKIYSTGFPRYEILPGVAGSPLSYIFTPLYLLVSGKVATLHWYIPFITIIYALSPFWIKLLSFENRTLKWLIFLISIALPFFFPRNASIGLNNFLYFLGVFFIGSLTSQHYDALSPYFKKFFSLFLLLGGGLFFLEIRFMSVPYINLLQKIFFCIGIMGMLSLLENKELPFLRVTATLSFAIYFIHPIMKLVWFYFFESPNGWGSWALMYSFVFFLSLGGAYFVKMIFKSNSKMIIGA